MGPIEVLTSIAKKHELKLIFDASHAFGCSHQGQMIGNFGSAEVFSFHATKFLNSFEGGAIATNDDELNQKLRLMKNFGFAGFDNVIYLGTNGKMSEASAAMGLTSLESMAEFVVVNRSNYQAYQRGLADLPGIKLFFYNPVETQNYQYVVVEVNEAEVGISRDLLVAILHAENVIARRYFYPGCHRMEPYRSYFPHAGLLLPQTEALCERVLVLPTGTAMSAAMVEQVCGIIRLAVDSAQQINSSGVLL